MHHPKHDGIVRVGDTLASPAQRDSQQGRRMMELCHTHVGSKQFSETVVLWGIGVRRSESETGDIFVDSLRNERDVEVELERRNIVSLGIPRVGEEERNIADFVLFSQEGTPVLLDIRLILPNEISLLFEVNRGRPSSFRKSLLQSRNDHPRIDDEDRSTDVGRATSLRINHEGLAIVCEE